MSGFGGPLASDSGSGSESAEGDNTGGKDYRSTPVKDIVKDIDRINRQAADIAHRVDHEVQQIKNDMRKDSVERTASEIEQKDRSGNDDGGSSSGGAIGSIL